VENFKGYFMEVGSNSTNTWKIFLLGGLTQNSYIKKNIKAEKYIKIFYVLKMFLLFKFYFISLLVTFSIHLDIIGPKNDLCRPHKAVKKFC
jgi:hypothetical protein